MTKKLSPAEMGELAALVERLVWIDIAIRGTLGGERYHHRGE